ncbi:MAG TPA: type II toxin-antitoxin system RelE/ParE family toxin [Cyclobacteriaceae bacterium]|nr:type II toxin-antitoxin system RelE/ParE family toxin [Cyclobacteriaceae bacterium]
MYKVLVSKTASKELADLPTQVVNRIVPAIKKLGDDPRPPGCKKLKGEHDTWRIRIGDYRVIYTVSDVVRIVDVRSVGHRKDIYD